MTFFEEYGKRIENERIELLRIQLEAIKQIRVKRKQLNMSYADVAALSKVDVPRIIDIEFGHCDPTMQELFAMKIALQIAEGGYNQ